MCGCSEFGGEGVEAPPARRRLPQTARGRAPQNGPNHHHGHRGTLHLAGRSGLHGLDKRLLTHVYNNIVVYLLLIEINEKLI